MAGKKGKAFFGKILILLFLILLIGGGYWVYKIHQTIFSPNVSLHGVESAYFCISTGSSFDDLTNLLGEKEYLKNTASFLWVAEKKNLRNNIHPGKYKLKDNMSNNKLVNLFRSGAQSPVKVLINPTRSRNIIASRVSRQLEADSIAISNLLNDKSFLAKYSVTNETWMSLFIPNTYEFLWNTSAEQFIERIAKENNRFWTKKRLDRAHKIGLSELEVSILASIVEQETIKNDEKPIIAGVYMNRLNKGMRLEADPTLIFALGDFEITRVLDVHKTIESPYNTYKTRGLPPGPICIPTIKSLDAVLNYKKHKYLFFCAKEDFSGYHNFAKTYSQHRINASKFQRELNRRRIWN
ncbi:MAG TPA: endolytic transglycosylase MltG [Flavobacteriales bacterium]|nr:endolytic transglycosylase MltG [Flavobacteriales bacterium]HIN39822.1 endolytic transglycosylase MltG [Flavobacteriales bacterium]